MLVSRIADHSAMGLATTAVKERRGRTRREVAGRVRILWQEDGMQRQAMGDIRDISERGLSCWMTQRLPSCTEIRLECAAQHLHGDAYVRHCTNKGARYLVGVEFRGSMIWRSADDPPTRPRWE